MKEYKSLRWIIPLFAILYCAISLVNHYNFRTAGWDLGLFNNALYDYAHFHLNNPTLLLPNVFTNTLADHFSLLPMLFSPLYWIFGSWTLLIIQILGVLWGGVGVFKLIHKITQNERLSTLATTFFFSVWGIYSALSFDYHDNVMAAMFVPWFIYYVTCQRWGWAIVYYLLILISKENMAIWLTFICFGLILNHWKEKRKVIVLLSLAIFASLYFAIVVKMIIPALGNNYTHFSYEALGKTFKEALITIVTKPRYTFSLLFENHTHAPEAFGIKSELHFVVLLSGGIALLFKPQYLIMLLPIYAQKMFNDDFGKWGINAQYSIEFVPILTIALFVWINDISDKYKLIAARIFLAICIITTIAMLDNRVSKWYSPEFSRFYQKDHYVRSFDLRKVYSALTLIPDDASVSAQWMLVSHLSFRKTIYHYPFVGDAEYITLIPMDSNTYPLSNEDYQKKLTELKNSKEWKVLIDDGNILILKKTVAP